ncbi:MAG: prepilin-type N-terminal cleavage/methylation domain-containing protein [Patescibacteria group bacterium]|nr:prepilin-type N-terminal cleavage/methylation domain-containing protein [Patescibacteria group bacterium]
MNKNRGYTLIELIVSVGLFAIVMLLASGAYLIMIGINRQVQGIATGIDNLSFALETMTRTIRTGTEYGCPSVGVDCPSGGASFSVTDEKGAGVSYTLSSPGGNGVIMQNGVALTDPSVNVSSLTFYAFGTASSDAFQPHVTIVVSGTVSYAAGKSEPFTVETGATMRGPDI